MILTLFDIVPNWYSALQVQYPMFTTFENIITADLNYGVAKVENALWPYPSCCVPKMLNCMLRVLYVILIRSWFTKSFDHMLPWYNRYLIIVPKLSSTKYVPYPIFITIKNIITVDLNYGFDKVQNALWPYPSYCALKMHQLYFKTVVRDLIRSWFTNSLEYMSPWYYCNLMIVP